MTEKCRIIYRMKSPKKRSSRRPKKPKERKVTVMLPVDLIERDTRISGEGLTPTLRKGLEGLTAREAALDLARMRGKFDLGLDYEQVKKDRE